MVTKEFLTVKNVKILIDSASDISLETAKKYNIDILGQNIIFGDETFVETTELSPSEFYEKLEKFGGIPKTAQINITKITEKYEQYYKDFDIIFITISSKASGTFQSANLAKDMFLEEHPDASIDVFDGFNLSLGYGRLGIAAAKMAQDGKGKDEILKEIARLRDKAEVIFVVDDLSYLQKGGRISPTAKILGNVLDIKPVLTIKDGLVTNLDKVRGAKKVYGKLVELMMSNIDLDEKHTVYIIHGNAPDKVEKLKEKIAEMTNITDIEVGEVGASVGTNTGAGVIALTYLKK